MSEIDAIYALARTPEEQQALQKHSADLRSPSNSAHSLTEYFTRQYQMFEGTELAALLEPRRIQSPPGFHSIKCVSAGLFALLGNRALKAAFGLPRIPTEIAAHVIAYHVIRYVVGQKMKKPEYHQLVTRSNQQTVCG